MAGDKRDERDTWSIDSEVGPRGGGAKSDGGKWVRLDEAARDARSKVAKVFGAGIRDDGKR